ncbi:membrane or secreted protein [Hymenobacter sp. RP-2-7]|uniref:Membrane or secreted protein n=1 Tax=Hymenobacter polaris TaxID=2682546 RepID=A0A7Y0FKV5_9BACT|nr:membrane or secreted protein [Hymenobacter polaris]NML63721.1 membrane or secreted protein [Hymenobacter polaris]
MLSINALRGLLALLLLTSLPALAQKTPTPPTGDVFVDKSGVLRWQNTKREVALFGVNYTAPFAYSYRTLARKGIRHEDAIDQDVYHLARLGVDAFRVHVWDVEITDTLGNVTPNEHLRLLDYLISKLEARGVKVILTPIAYWGNGYPEPDNTGKGFSSLYDKGQAYTNPRAIRAQETYLGQFLNHRNQYTGQLYRQDPGIIAYEVCNEPHYHLPLGPVLSFANRMVAAMRATGLTKPIFYNIAESPQVHDAILDANVQGVSFQWYPEGLVAGHELQGNLLPYVDQYPLPYRGDERFERRAKMVYEFESADVLQPIMYPSMARSFRAAGFQWATQFAYDPLGLAPYNTEYQTHYLNLAYTPAKALSLLIAGKVFRETKRGQSFGRYPADSVAGAATVSYRRQLSEWNAPTEFYYTADTRDQPRQPTALRHVAGVGSSAVAQYGGSGAYFLDQVAPGVWRLEVMPDAMQVRDPFETASEHKEVTQLGWQPHPLTLALPDLGPQYHLARLSADARLAAYGEPNQAAQQGRVVVAPGVYLLARQAADLQRHPATEKLGNIQLGEYVAPRPKDDITPAQAWVRHQPVAQATAGQPLLVAASVLPAAPTDSVWLVARHYYGPVRRLPMQRTGPTTYAATVPAALTYPGQLQYWVVTSEAGRPPVTYPGRQPGTPRQWDFADQGHYTVPLVPAGAPLPLFGAAADQGHVEAQGLGPQARIDYPSTSSGALALRLVAAPPKAGAPAPAPGPAAALRTYLGPKLAGRLGELGSFKELVVKGSLNLPAAAKLRVLFVTKDAVAYAADVPLGPALGEGRVPLSALRPAPLLLTPRPYPGFLPLTYSPATPPPFQLAEVEVLQLVLDRLDGTPAEQIRADVEAVELR